MPVGDQKPAEALAVQRAEDLAHDGDERLEAQCRATGKRAEAGRDPVGDHRQHRDAERFRGFDGEPLDDDVVSLEREVGVLLRRAERQHDAIVALQIFLELHPVQVANPHA